MADFKGLTYGTVYPATLSTGSIGSFTLDQSTDAQEWIFQAPAAITITRLGYRLTTVTGTSPVFKISLQGVDASGNPDGTIKGGGTPASATFTPAGSNNWFWVNLDNAYTCTRGEYLAIVIAQNSGTIDGSNNVSFGNQFGTGQVYGFPYGIQNNAGVRTRVTLPALYGFGSSTVAYGAPAKNFATTLFSSNSTPDEYALKFTIPASLVSTYSIAGAVISGIIPSAAKSTKMILYDGTSVLQTTTTDSDHFSGNGVARSFRIYFQDATLATLLGGNTYRLSLQPQDLANNSSIYRLEFAAAADLDAWPGGQDFAQSTRTDAGAWTDDTTLRPIIELIVGDWTTGSGPVGSGRLTGGLQ